MEYIGLYILTIIFNHAGIKQFKHFKDTRAEAHLQALSYLSFVPILQWLVSFTLICIFIACLIIDICEK